MTTELDEATVKLLPLAELVCRLEQQRGLTPVLVCPTRVVLADAFYVGLCEAVIAESGRAVRLDLLPGHLLAPFGNRFADLVPRRPNAAWLPVPLAARLAKSTRRLSIHRLTKQLPDQASLEATATVARPNGRLRDLVIGLAGPTDQIPSFAEPVRFDLQLTGQAA